MELLCSGSNAERVEDPTGEFAGCIEPEPSRYVLYVVAGCAFSGRPWFVTKFYGLEDYVRIVKAFPGNNTDFFFSPVDDWEQNAVATHPEAAFDEDPVLGATHLQQIYALHPEYKGMPSVPVLYDMKVGKIVTNDSLSMAKAGMRSVRTRNKDVELLPADDDVETNAAHNALLQEHAREMLSKVYRINGSATQDEHTKLSLELFEALAKAEKMLAASSEDAGRQFLMGTTMRLADIDLFNFAIRFELAYRWRFNIGGDSLEGAKYASIWNLVKRLLSIPGITGQGGSIIPGDIVRSYWLSNTLAARASHKSAVPLLPSAFTATGFASPSGS